MDAATAKIYKRFIKNYQTSDGNINIYPQFNSDLNEILKYISYDVKRYEQSIIDCLDPNGGRGW